MLGSITNIIKETVKVPMMSFQRRNLDQESRTQSSNEVVDYSDQLRILLEQDERSGEMEIVAVHDSNHDQQDEIQADFLEYSDQAEQIQRDEEDNLAETLPSSS